MKRFRELAEAYGAAGSDGKYRGFWSDPFCVRDFYLSELKVAMPRLALAIIFFVLGLFCNSVSQAWLQRNLSGYYEKLCENKGLHPEDKALWDITFKMLPRVPSTHLADIFAMAGPAVLVLRFIVLPGPISMRWTILRRWLTVWGLIWFIRSVTIFVTPLPNPDASCKPIISAPDNLLLEAVYIATQQDLTCQDVMFSGHTVALTLAVLFLCRYISLAPWSSYMMNRGWLSLNTFFHVVGYIFTAIGYYCIAGSRFHYTLDVLVGSLVTITTFRAYHDKIELTWLRREHGGSDLLDHFLYWLDAYAKDRKVLTGRKHTQEEWLSRH
eukprot:SRR837773.5621.p2 GENE.SRR837773.5621~~SRR837773.5621.p2  ORF type:complete len:351 (+),score=110.26 SRR837773.5621:76-1053(+)